MGLQDSKTERCKASGSEGKIDWITLDEVDALLRETSEEFDQDNAAGFFTTLEWSWHWGVHERTAQRRLVALKRAERVEMRQMTRWSINNRPYKVTGYRIIK